jgi:DNA-directed RNA polymerase subunit N (RpoN/RPB10)
MNASFTTVPIRCAACGQQTHKTLESVIQNGGMQCECGFFTTLDTEQFAEEIKKQESKIKDFGRSR